MSGTKFGGLTGCTRIAHEIWKGDLRNPGLFRIIHRKGEEATVPGEVTMGETADHRTTLTKFQTINDRTGGDVVIYVDILPFCPDMVAS